MYIELYTSLFNEGFKCYNEGNLKKAVSLFEKGVEINCSDSMFSLGRYYIDHEDELIKGLILIEKAANLNNKHALADLGSLYYNLKNTKKGIYFLEKAAENGSLHALNLLLIVCKDGLYDYDKYMKLYNFYHDSPKI